MTLHWGILGRNYPISRKPIMRHWKNAVCARYNGVITGVELEAGDKISTGTSLVTLYDMDEVTITVTVDEDDMTNISLGSAANIALTAYPEDTFMAKVTAIGDATSDSSGNITYDVTVTLEGDVSLRNKRKKCCMSHAEPLSQRMTRLM